MPARRPPAASRRPQSRATAFVLMERPTRATRAILTTSITEFSDAVHTAIASAVERDEGAALLSVILDQNETDGAPASAHSEAVQQQVIELIRRNLRGNDVVAHPPGDELMVL